MSTQIPQHNGPVQVRPTSTSTQIPEQDGPVQVRPTSNPDRRDEPMTRRSYTESKSGFKTSEFYVMLVFVAGVLLATYADSDSLARKDGWMVAGLTVAAYIISRGLAKLGTREPYDDDRN